ncbi:MAG: insulinase family protein [Clostridia bacterium]|nr:insulinase family protein [Clostridia bacterium]
MEEKRYESRQGVPLYVYSNPALHSFYFALYVRAGSLYEDEGEQGIAHMLEHILIRNVNVRSGGVLYRTLDRLGLEFNASTYRDCIQFYVSGARTHIAAAAELLCRLFAPIALSAQDYEAERRRIKAEIRESDDKNTLSSFTAACLYPDTSGRFSILGTNRSVTGISQRRLEAYRGRVMCPENMFFYLTGNVKDADVATLLRAVDAYELPHGQGLTERPTRPAAFGRRDGAVYVKGADYTMARLSFDVDMSEVSYAACDLLCDALFTGYNARFFLELSEARGMCYDLSGGADRYHSIGCLYVTFEVKGRDLYDAVAASVELLREAKAHPMSPDVIPTALYVDGADMLLDDASELNFTMAYDAHILACPYRTLEDRKAAYRAVTPEELMAAARAIFCFDRCTLTVKGDKKAIDRDRLRELLRRLDLPYDETEKGN